MLNDILILDKQWLPNQSDFPPIPWPWYRAWPSPIMSGFHGAFATDVACEQETLTLPDTWFRPPLWDLLVLQLLRPNSSNLPCLYSTFHLEYPFVLSRFSFLSTKYIWMFKVRSPEKQDIENYDLEKFGFKRRAYASPKLDGTSCTEEWTSLLSCDTRRKYVDG